MDCERSPGPTKKTSMPSTARISSRLPTASTVSTMQISSLVSKSAGQAWRIVEACRAMLAIDEDGVRLQLREARRQSRGDMVGVYHQNMLARGKALAQFGSDHRLSPVASGLLLEVIRTC